MDLRIVNPQAKYPKVTLIQPPPLGHLHVAAAVDPPRGRTVSGQEPTEGGAAHPVAVPGAPVGAPWHTNDPPTAVSFVGVWTVAASSRGFPAYDRVAGATRRGTVVGASCWILTVAYFIVQPVVAAAWPTPYDLATNSISDLGVTRCGSYPQFDDRVVYACSPRHALMNTVFVLVGVLTAAGAVLTRGVWPWQRVASVGVAFVVLAGVGGILVGLAPANVNLAAHAAGALLQVPGAVGPLLLGVAAWRAQRGSRPSRCSAGSSGRLPACCTSAGATLGWASA